MKKSFILAILLLSALPAFSQSSQFGLLLGGSKRLYSNQDKKDRDDLQSDSWKLKDSVKEVWYAVEMEPGTWFRLRGGEIDTAVGPVIKKEVAGSVAPQKGRIQHLDALIDYKFSEPYGSTGLFAGVGFYRDQPRNGSSQSNYGFSAGVNGDFPLSRRYGVIVEGTYHWVNFDYNPRLVTLTGGLRISF